MSIFRLLLPRVALFLTLLLLGGFSHSSLAWEGHHRAPWLGTTLIGEKCDGGQVPFGPYDYLQRASLPGQLEVVEENHFTPNIENLQSGNTTTAMGDIHYTLQTWPNHHRALKSAVQFRLQHRELWRQPADLHNYPAECYLQRAINFSPNDPVPYMLYGMLMHEMQQYDKALQAYKSVVRLQPGDMIAQYNMGLTLLALKRYPEAKQIAQAVYSKGFPLPGLKRKLIAVGQWDGGPNPADNKAAANKPANKNAAAPAADVSAVLNAEAKNAASTAPNSTGPAAAGAGKDAQPKEAAPTDTGKIAPQAPQAVPATNPPAQVTPDESAATQVRAIPRDSASGDTAANSAGAAAKETAP
jgi:hypothetical protein